MPNDAKLGMIFGVGLVILVAVLFFRKEVAEPATAEPVAIATNSQPTPTPSPKTPALRKHRVRDGETLSGLAQRYFNDDSRTPDLRRVNPHLPEGDELTPGLELVIPDVVPPGNQSAQLPK